MKWLAVKVIIDEFDAVDAVDLIGELFRDIGVGGVVVEEPLDQNDIDWAEPARPHHQTLSVTGYFEKDRHIDRRLASLQHGLGRLISLRDLKYHLEYETLSEEDWAESWKAYFWPIKVGRRIVIKPTWRDYDKIEEDEILCEIDPGMAFGTGTHATTALCIRLLEKYVNPGDSFLDIGTGSGILMIAAAKLGAARVRGTDTDPTAVSIAAQNLELNGISAERMTLEVGSLADGVEASFEIVAANLLTETILTLLDSIEGRISPGGILICSGITESNLVRVQDKIDAGPLAYVEHIVEDGWVAVAVKRVRT